MMFRFGRSRAQPNAVQGMPKDGVSSWEKEKWDQDFALRQEEIAIKRAEADIKNKEAEIKLKDTKIKRRETALKTIELRRSRFTNPLVLAIVGATLAGIGTGIGAGIAALSQIELEKTKYKSQQELERFKADSTLILEVIKTNNDTAKAKLNLAFLVGAGLISDPARRSELGSYLKGPGPVPSLPSASAGIGEGRSIGIKCITSTPPDIAKLASNFEKSFRDNPIVNNIELISRQDFSIIVIDISKSDTMQGIIKLNFTMKARAIFVINKIEGGFTFSINLQIPGSMGKIMIDAVMSQSSIFNPSQLAKKLETMSTPGSINCAEN